MLRIKVAKYLHRTYNTDCHSLDGSKYSFFEIRSGRNPCLPGPDSLKEDVKQTSIDPLKKTTATKNFTEQQQKITFAW